MRNLETGAALREAIAEEQLAITIIELDVDSDASVEAAFSKILSDTCRALPTPGLGMVPGQTWSCARGFHDLSRYGQHVIACFLSAIRELH